MATISKKRGNRDEVWNGIAEMTSGGLHKSDLIMNNRGVIVSKRQSDAAKERYPQLVHKLCAKHCAIIPKQGNTSNVENPAAYAKQEEEEEILFYFGSGWDFKPISSKFYTRINRFIFIDALPKLAHYTPEQAGYKFAKDEMSFVKKLKDCMLKKGTLITEKPNLLEWRIRDNGILEYHYNMTVNEALENPRLLEMWKQKAWCHIEGFNPHEFIGDRWGEARYENKNKLMKGEPKH